MQEWISIRERKPENRCPVLVYVESHGVKIAWIDKAGWLSNSLCWWFENESDNECELDDYITHWMPLPEPPK